MIIVCYHLMCFRFQRFKELRKLCLSFSTGKNRQFSETTKKNFHFWTFTPYGCKIFLPKKLGAQVSIYTRNIKSKNFAKLGNFLTAKKQISLYLVENKQNKRKTAKIEQKSNTVDQHTQNNKPHTQN